MTVLEFIKKQMSTLGINFDFDEWTAEDIPKLYWIGALCEEDNTIKIISHNTGGFKEFFSDISKMKKHFAFQNKIKLTTETNEFVVRYGGHDVFPPEKQGERTKAEIMLLIKKSKTPTEQTETECIPEEITEE